MSWNELSLKDKADYIKESVNNGIYNLSDIRNRYNMYANGGYKPSESIKKRITNWEGSSMRTNRSFQAEANDFNRVIPSSIRSKLSQQQLDALYSYGYNVGMGKLKKRVLPTLTDYIQGKASNEDVQKSMWASKDNELRGLTTRRNIERSLFGGKYQTVFTGTGGTPHNHGYTTTNRSSSNPYQIQNEEWQGKNYLGAYKGLQLSMNDIMGKTKENDIDDLFSTGIGPTISMDNLLSIGNNNVAPVQPDYSYAKLLLSDFDSDLNSNMFGNGGKIPRTNKILKKATHPTYGMALREDAIEGYLPVYNNGETYTYPLPWIKAYGGKINMFAEGGNLSYIDADNRRSNILLHTENGNLYDSAGNNYTQSYLDEEHVPIIKGTMPRNTRQYYDPNTTLEFINAATAPISNFSPSNIVGSIREARDYNTFMNSFMNQDNTGFFTREYTKEHPYISTLGNIGGDILLGTALNKGYNTFKNNINSRINKKLFNKAIDNMANISDKKLDKIYNRIYNTGDYEDLQQLRDKHFEIKAGNPLMSRDKPMQLYHTVGDEYNPNFNIFNPTIEGSNSAIYTTDNLAMSKSYSSKPTYGRIKKLYSNASKSYDIEGYYQPWNEIPYNGNMWSTRTLEKAVRSHPQYGIDRLVIHNIKDWGGKAMPKGTFLMDGNIKSSGTVIENLNPNDLKYSSAVTYDDLGNIIPLSERDNFSISDLRYSLIPLGTGATLLNSKVK